MQKILYTLLLTSIALGSITPNALVALNDTSMISIDSGPGTLEQGMRYTQTDMTDGIIQGGKFGRFTTNLSWYPNAHFRLETSYVKGSL